MNNYKCPECGGKGYYPDMSCDDTPFGVIRCQTCKEENKEKTLKDLTKGSDNEQVQGQ